MKTRSDAVSSNGRRADTTQRGSPPVTSSKVLTDFDALLVRAFHSSTRRTWICYRESGRIFGDYRRGAASTAALAQKLGVSSESIANWARAGWLRAACRGLSYEDEAGQCWTFYDLRRALSLAHFQVAGRALQQELLGPRDVFERLAICATQRKSAGWLAAQIMPIDSNHFVMRLKRLLSTPLPSSWPAAKRRAGAEWLKAGQKLLK